MAITTYIQQPGSNSLHAAYRPVLLRVLDEGSNPPPVVYCDIYFNGVYYRTIGRTMFAHREPNRTEWQFDIQDPAQEFLKHYLAQVKGTELALAAPVMLRAFCRVRGSNVDSDNLIVPDGPEPVQATGSSPATAGGGLQSQEFFILNATLQHEDNQSLPDHLNAFKSGSWAPNCYPVSHRPDQPINRGDSDYFPVIVPDTICVAQLQLSYRQIGEGEYTQALVNITDTCTATILTLTVTQLPASTNMQASWTASGNPIGYQYRVDGGPWLQTSNTAVVLSGLALGFHNIEVKPVCNCAVGTGLIQGFTVVDVATLCNSIVEIISITQTGAGQVSIEFNSTGPATTWRYRLNGGSFNTTTSTTIVLSDLSLGQQNILIEPVCTDGQIGAGASANFEVESQGGGTTFYEYQVRLSTFIEGHCSVLVTIAYSDQNNFITGMVLYQDMELTTPITGFNFVSDAAGTALPIYTMDGATGTVGTPTANIC